MSNLIIKDRLKLFGGGCLSYLYNGILAKVPSRKLRKLYLKVYLKKMGLHANVQINVRFLNGRKITLGNNNAINFDCLFDGRKYPITVGDNVSIGPEATLLTLGHDPQSPNFQDKGGPIEIGNHCWIAYRAIVMPGVRMGEGSVLAAGSVLTKDAEPFGIYAGIPAKKIGERTKQLTYECTYNPWLV